MKNLYDESEERNEKGEWTTAGVVADKRTRRAMLTSGTAVDHRHAAASQRTAAELYKNKAEEHMQSGNTSAAQPYMDEYNDRMSQAEGHDLRAINMEGKRHKNNDWQPAEAWEAAEVRRVLENRYRRENREEFRST